MPVQVALDPKLTRAEPYPVRPVAQCRDAGGKPTLCNRALADWINAYDAALQNINDRMAQILKLQPKVP